MDLLTGGHGRGAASRPLSGSSVQPLSTRSVTIPTPGPAQLSQITSRAWSCWVQPGPGLGGTFPVQPLPGSFNLCESAVKPQSPADPRSSGRTASPWLWGFEGAHGCPCMPCPQCPRLWQPRGTSTAAPAAPGQAHPTAHSIQLAEGAGGSLGGSQGLPSPRGAFHLLLHRCWLWLVSDMHQLQSNSPEPLAKSALEQLS